MARPPRTEQRRRLERLWKQGVAAAAIAARLGYKNEATVYAVANRWGLAPRGHKRRSA